MFICVSLYCVLIQLLSKISCDQILWQSMKSVAHTYTHVCVSGGTRRGSALMTVLLEAMVGRCHVNCDLQMVQLTEHSPG